MTAFWVGGLVGVWLGIAAFGYAEGMVMGETGWKAVGAALAWPWRLIRGQPF